MAKRGKKQNVAGLYILIVLCLVSSVVAIWGVVNKLETSKESAFAYEALKEEAFIGTETEVEEEEEESSFEVEESPSHGLEEQDIDPEEAMSQIRGGDTWPDPLFTEETSPLLFANGQSAVPVPAAAVTEAPGVSSPLFTKGQTAAPTPTAKLTVSPLLSSDEPAADLGTGAPSTPGPVIAQAMESPPASQAHPQGARSPAPSQPALPSGDGGVESALAVSPTPTPAPTVYFAGPTPRPTAPPTPKPTEERVRRGAVELDRMRYTINFDLLRSLNPEIVAWLLQEGTVINYPVLQGKNNEVYLERMFNSQRSSDGSLFMDCGNKRTFIDANTYIYGHNTKAGSMFASLSNYREQAYYDQHPEMLLLTPYSDFIIDIFAGIFCLVEDETSWRVKQFERKAEFEAYIRGLKEKSYFHSEITPEWGDQLLVLVTCTNIRHGQRYVIYGRMKPIRYASKDRVSLTKINMDSRPSQNGMIRLPGRGQAVVYAQNDSQWSGFRFETPGSGKKRPFEDGGAGPTAVAMAVAALVPQEELPRLGGYAGASEGFTFCACSANRYYCNRLHAQYQIQSPEEYLRYLPMAMADFASGNNMWNLSCRDQSSGTNLRFIEYVAGAYGLSLRASPHLSDALEALGQGAVVVAATNRTNAFSKGGHYVVLAAADDQFVYVLDPFRRDGYRATDREGSVELVAPGVSRVWRGIADRLGLAAFYILYPPAEH